MNYALIFAGGVGSRMGSNIPKQFLEINNKPIIVHTIERFNDTSYIDAIVVVTLKEYINTVKSFVNYFNLTKVISIIEGGNTAFESQFKGISYLSSISKCDKDIVIVHDGVRPFINSSLIFECIKKTKENGNAVVVSPASETIAIVDNNSQITHTIPRQECLIARAPQCFFLKDLIQAHQKAKAEGKQYIDSASMFLDQGVVLNPIEGPIKNIKITTQYDYLLAKLLVEDKNEKD